MLVKIKGEFFDAERIDNPLTVKVKEILPGCMPEKIGVGDWIDLKAGRHYRIAAGTYKLVRLGIAVELPDGYEAHIVPRSSTFKKYGVLLANSFGVIDNSYRGDNDEWGFPVYATRNTFIPKGTRIAQFRVVRNQPELELVRVESLGNENRGGFGSTGD